MEALEEIVRATMFPNSLVVTMTRTPTNQTTRTFQTHDNASRIAEDNSLRSQSIRIRINNSNSNREDRTKMKMTYLVRWKRFCDIFDLKTYLKTFYRD